MIDEYKLCFKIRDSKGQESSMCQSEYVDASVLPDMRTLYDTLDARMREIIGRAGMMAVRFKDEA